MLTKQEYDEVKARSVAHEQWVDTLRKHVRCRACCGTSRNRVTLDACEKCNGKGHTLGWASYREEDRPATVPAVSNDERSAIEVYEFVSNPPERYFLYVNEDARTVTTWTGEKLGDLLRGDGYYSSFGDMRVPVTVHAINGRTYHGTYYKSAGSYARVKMARQSVTAGRKEAAQ